MTLIRRLRDLGWINLSLLFSGFVIVAILMLFRLGSLTKGLSLSELQTSHRAIGWHGIYNAPFNLPLKLVRSIDFFLYKQHGQFLTRAPNAIFGILTVATFAWLSMIWHGRRTAILATVLLATGAWTLHVSRLASSDVSYLWAIISLLLCNALIMRQKMNQLLWILISLIVGMMFTIPGFIFLIIFSIYMQRNTLLETWNKDLTSLFYKGLSILLLILWLPLTVINLFRPGQVKLWIGFPANIANFGKLLKQFIALPVHLFFRGPQYPTLWLGKAPLLDAFSLFLVLAGIYFYCRHWRSHRSRLIGGLFLISWIVVALGGDVSFSLVVGFMYVLAAMGISYLLHVWFRVFPSNPLARSFGVMFISLAVTISCLYNLRSYYIAWPHSPVTKQFFNRRVQ